MSSFLGIAFIIGLVVIGFPLYHRDLYIPGDIPSFCLAMVMSLVRLHRLSIVTEVVEPVCLSITTTSMLRLALGFLKLDDLVSFPCLLLSLSDPGSLPLDSELEFVFS